MIENLNTLLKTNPNLLVAFLDDVRHYLDDAKAAELDLEDAVAAVDARVSELNAGEFGVSIDDVIHNNIHQGFNYTLDDRLSQSLPNGMIQFKSIGQIILDACGVVLQELDREEPYYEGPAHVHILFSVHTHADRDLALVDYESIADEVAQHSLGTFTINGSYCSYGGTTWDSNVTPVTVKLKSVLDIQEKQYGF